MNGKRAVRWGAVVSLVAVLAAVAGGSTARGASQDGYTLRIGVVVPFTGASAVFGPAYAKAAGLAVQQAKTTSKDAYDAAPDPVKEQVDALLAPFRGRAGR